MKPFLCLEYYDYQPISLNDDFNSERFCELDLLTFPHHPAVSFAVPEEEWLSGFWFEND
jgi:hypothetical protein